MVPYEVDITKLSTTIGIQRLTTLKYLKYLEEASLIHQLFTEMSTITDLQKPDKILLDNSNLLYTLSDKQPEIGTVRETFLCNQLHSAGHRVEYGGMKSGDFRVDGNLVIEVGGADKGLRQVKDEANGYIAADDIESATFHKIPLWAIVGETEADFSKGRLAATTPIAKALLGHGKGEVVEAQVPSGTIKFKILEISL